MSSYSLAITTNGPGEFAGWVRPLLGALYARTPSANVHLFFVPDDYATGSEPDVARSTFPQAHVHPPAVSMKASFGRVHQGLPATFDGVQYLGGDLSHAVRLAKRFSAKAFSYKFSRPAYREIFARAFAVDMANVESLVAARMHRDRILLTGNLAIDGALFEAQQPLDPGAPEDGILMMPGSRKYEVQHLVPFFLTTAMRIARERPDIPIAFGISPFTALEDVRKAVEAGGDPRVFAQRGSLVTEDGRTYLCDRAQTLRFPVVRSALSAATRARLVVTIPGTKTIEAAALGKPVVACVPLNAPELIAINGPLTYLDRLPLVGVALKRSAVLAVSKRFEFFTQPNIDAQEALIAELRGTLTPGHVARVTLERFEDSAWIARTAMQLKGLYKDHVGAAERMAIGIEDALQS
ncbi:MAG: hypothetical protein M3N19_05590 [Candidatus Eremiobacteraeota bacterium]|nr:hypothetical protein [Candidatus Eremiobacteraeota bacterium]